MKKTWLTLTCITLLLGLLGCQTADPHAAIPHDTTAQQTEKTTEPQTDVQTEPETSDSLETETALTTEPIEETFTPPADMTLLGDIAQVPPSTVVYEFHGDNDCTSSLFHHTEDIHVNRTTSQTKAELEGAKVTADAASPYLGVAATGTYTDSKSQMYYAEDYDCYSATTESGNKYGFSINSNTGKLVEFSYQHEPVKIDGQWYDNAVLDDLDKPFLTQEECTKIVEGLFYKGMGATGTYTMTVRYRPDPSLVHGFYSYRFTRTVDGKETNEDTFIYITDRGRIILISAIHFGSFDNADLPDYNEEELTAAVEYKLAKIYKDVLDTHSLYYNVESSKLARLNDGKFYLEYQLEVYMITEQGTSSAHDHVNLLVCIG